MNRAVKDETRRQVWYNGHSTTADLVAAGVPLVTLPGVLPAFYSVFPFSSLFLSSLELSDTQVYEPGIRAILGTASHSGFLLSDVCFQITGLWFLSQVLGFRVGNIRAPVVKGHLKETLDSETVLDFSSV